MNGITKWPGSPLLQAVGRTLDDGLECVAYERGFVWPAAKHVPRGLAGMVEGVMTDGAEREEGAQTGPGGSESGPWQGTTPGDSAEGATDRSAGAPVVGGVARIEGDERVEGLTEALRRYEQFDVSSASAGVLKLFGVIQPIADLPISASLVVYVPLANPVDSRAWAWWTDGMWIGPRHTYVDGNVCAFEVADGTWRPELGVRLLLDLCAVWLARQLYLRAYGRWPGLQRIHTPVERLTEQLPGEYCGCGRARLYEVCCAGRDHHAASAGDIRRRRDDLMRRGPNLPPL